MTPEDVTATPNGDLRAENAKLRAHLKEAHALGAEAKKGWDEAAAGWRTALLQVGEQQKKYSDLLQSHASLCGKIEEFPTAKSIQESCLGILEKYAEKRVEPSQLCSRCKTEKAVKAGCCQHCYDHLGD